MVPSIFLRVEQFPLTPNGKLDRKALPPPPGNRPSLAQDFIAPRTALEKRMAGLWCELLRLDEMGIDDNFFDLGGTSLAAVRMVSLYHHRFDKEIPPVKVFQYPTVSQLCRFLEESGLASGFVKEVEHRPCRLPTPQESDPGSTLGRRGRDRHGRPFSRREQHR